MEFFTFISVCKSVHPLTFLVFFNVFELCVEFVFYDTHIELLQGKFFWLISISLSLTSMQNADDTAQKNKNIFYIYVLVFHFASVSCLGGIILSKKVKIVIL
jgi:hypothetical protein